MPLRVICYVDQQSTKRSWQPLRSHGSYLFQIENRQRPHPPQR